MLKCVANFYIKRYNFYQVNKTRTIKNVCARYLFCYYLIEGEKYELFRYESTNDGKATKEN